MKTLRFILGDQLNTAISSLQKCDKSHDIVLMCEVWQEATYVKHHKKKLALIFSAMRHFAQALKQQQFQVDYITLTDPHNSGSFFEELKRAVKRHKPNNIVVTFPGEYRVWQDLQTWADKLGITVEVREDDRFLCSREEFAKWAEGRKQLRMEYFYRQMRQKHHVLISNGKPSGGKWNYDSANRKPPTTELNIPPPYQQQADKITQEVIKLVEEKFSDHFGELEPFDFAVTREQALKALHYFIQHRLRYFGDYQDAMLANEPWMFHSQISCYLNCGLLVPLECIKAAEEAYQQKQAPLNAVEGFIRQILGWREYVRGIYWLTMPEYAQANFLQAKRDLPEFFWTGDTDLNCLRQCITETKQNAYAHHIQRLMVLGNFALLTGIDPKQVNEWYLIVYADAYEWVEMPNVTGMILFADGGKLASKPYAAGGAYINKMSNYCKQCRYKVNEKQGEQACPFNYLYWHFLSKNRVKLAKNPRLAMMYNTFDKMNAQQISAINSDAKKFLRKLTKH